MWWESTACCWTFKMQGNGISNIKFYSFFFFLYMRKRLLFKFICCIKNTKLTPSPKSFPFIGGGRSAPSWAIHIIIFCIFHCRWQRLLVLKVGGFSFFFFISIWSFQLPSAHPPVPFSPVHLRRVYASGPASSQRRRLLGQELPDAIDTNWSHQFDSCFSLMDR